MTNYRITPFKHWTGKWAWWATRSHDYGGDTPTFYIAKADHYNMEAGERLCCWATAADTDTWTDFDNVTIGATDLTFSMDTPFPAGLIYVSALPMYPFSRIQRKVNQWSASPWVSQTASTTNFVLGSATPRTVPDDSGRTAPALPFYGLKITGDRVGSKNKAILSACNHATETPGPYMLEAVVDYLLGASAQAEVLRDYFEFFVYPCVNPQSVWSGWFRSCPEYVGPSSHDGIWDETGTAEDVDAFKTAMAADTGGAIDVIFDYHSWMSNNTVLGAVNTGDTTGNYGYFTTEIQAYEATFYLYELDMSPTLTYYGKTTLGASLAMTLEQGGTLARDISDWKTYGERTMLCLYEMLVDDRFTYGID